jgi:hypothetical protein
MRTKIVTLPSGQRVMLVHRDDLAKAMPKRMRAALPPKVPATPLPIDSSGNGSCPNPMDDNDSLGICGLAMCDHTNRLRTYGQGKPGFTILQAPIDALVSQYETVSGGDNGTTEDMLVGNSGGPDGSSGPGVWLIGIAGDPTATVVDHLDLGDGSNEALLDFCLDWFYSVCKAWSVPDEVLQTFQPGATYYDPLPADPANGHFTCLSDADANSGSSENNGKRYRDWTWGSYFWESPAFMAATQPQLFTTFSALQFNSSGYDSKGRHVSDVAASWVAIGGSASIVAEVVAKYPPSSPPTDIPPTEPNLEPVGGPPLPTRSAS